MFKVHLFDDGENSIVRSTLLSRIREYLKRTLSLAAWPEPPTSDKYIRLGNQIQIEIQTQKTTKTIKN